jgi:hypothetical protein
MESYFSWTCKSSYPLNFISCHSLSIFGYLWEVGKIYNKVKAFFLTAFGEGYTEEFVRRFPSSLFSDISFIRKPIRMDDLVKKVNEVI